MIFYFIFKSAQEEEERGGEKVGGVLKYFTLGRATKMAAPLIFIF